MRLLPLILSFTASLLLLLLQGSCGVSGKLKHYKWQVDYELWAPDCVEKLIISINGQYPGPTIRATAGDTIVVELENLMPTESVLVHWHGIRQKGTPWYDGAGGVSQCAIQPGETFVYKFIVDKPGTFFYHGHLGLQRSAGFYGSLIVDVEHGSKEPFHYDGELSLILNDWWHRSAYEQGLGLYSIPFKWVGEPQSLLIEGRGQYNCSLIGGNDIATTTGDSPTCNPKNPQCAPLVLRVNPGKTYRLRIASVASLSSLNFQIEGHKMRVVEADGNYVEEVELDNLNVYSGETYSVLVEALTAPPNGQHSFWITTHVQGRLPKTPPGLAILTYSIKNDQSEISYPTTLPPLAPAAWNDTKFNVAQSRLFVARQGSRAGPPPQKADKVVVLLNTQNRVAGRIKWALNNVSLVLPGTPFLAALKFGLGGLGAGAPPEAQPPPHYDIFAPPPNPNATLGSPVYHFPLGSTVDLVLQNANTLNPNNSETHPWHMHGHEFWVLGFGDGQFDPARDPSRSFNLRDPPLRNTVPLFPYGWTAVRFVADNPGVWPFHCHLESHFHMGMGIVFAQGLEKLGKPPSSTLGCGLTKRWLP